MALARSVEEFLRQHHVDYQLVNHPRTVSSMRTAQAAHIPGERLAKSVLLEDEIDYLMAVIPSTHRVDLGKLHQQLHRHVGLAIEDEVVALFPDCDPGAIPAVGAAYRVETIVDDSLLQQPEIYFEAGDHQALVRVSGPAFGAMMTDVQHGQIARHV